MPPGEQGPVGGGALDGAPPPDAGAATAPARWRARASTAALALAIVLAYSNSWRAPFVFDDGFNIVRNPIVHDLSHFVHPWRVDGTVAPPALVYTLWSRYPAYLSFALDYALHGLDVRGYHVVNLAIHLAAALTVVALVRALLALPLFDRSRLRGREGATALLAGALFGLHPLQTQSVTYVVQRMTSLGGLFCLLAMLAYVRARCATAPGPRRALAGAAAALLLAGMATKQNYVAFPLVMIAADLVLFPGGWRLRRRWLVLPALGLALGLAASLGLREAAAGLGPRYEVGNLGPDLSRSDYQRTQIDVLVTYLRLFALPTGQNLDYDYPVAKSWAEPALLAKLALLVALAAVGVGLSASNRTRDPGWRLVGLGIVWFFAMHAVESSGVEVLDLIFEHRMYLPSVGLVLAVVVGAAAGLPERLTRPAAAALAAAALVLGAATYARNEVWRSESRLWKDVLAKSPKKVRPLLAMGERMLELRRVGEAERYFERAYQLDPGHATVLVQLGAIAQMKGDAARAEDLFRRVLEIEPNHWIALANLGDLALARGDREEALRYFAHAAEHEQLSTLARARLERLRRSEASPTPAPAPSRSPATP